MTIRSILVATILALGFASSVTAQPEHNSPAHAYANTVQHGFYGQ